MDSVESEQAFSWLLDEYRRLSDAVFVVASETDFPLLLELQRVMAEDNQTRAKQAIVAVSSHFPKN